VSIACRMIAQRRYLREQSVELIGEIEDINDENKEDLERHTETLNRVINLFTAPTDTVDYVSKQTNDQVEIIPEPIKISTKDLVSVDSVSLDSITESPPAPRVVSVDIHHDPDSDDNDSVQRMVIECNNHEDLEYEEVVVTRIIPPQAIIVNIPQICKKDQELEDIANQSRTFLVQLDENENRIGKEQPFPEDSSFIVQTLFLEKGAKSANGEKVTKPSSIMKNVHINDENKNVTTKTAKKHTRNVKFTTEGTVDQKNNSLSSSFSHGEKF